MKLYLQRFLGVDEKELGRVLLLLLMGFFMGMFLATVTVASQALFLDAFDETNDLPRALLVSGVFGIIATFVYNLLQNRIPFPWLAFLSLLLITGITAFLEYGEYFFDPEYVYFLGFTQIIPFGFIIYLIFWGTFSRMFNIRQTKRLVGSVDAGGLIASLISFFSIPVILRYIDQTENLYFISLLSIIGFTLTFFSVSTKYLSKTRTFAEEKILHRKLSIKDFTGNRYIMYMSLFVIMAMMSVNFVDYSFLNVTTLRFEDKDLPVFLSQFEGTVVVFCFLFQTFATDRIISEYGLRVALIINPILIALFTGLALGLGVVFGYTPTTDSFVVFFIMISMSKLFVRSLRDALDNPTFKLYLLPIDSKFRIDVQTKIEGIVTAFASLLAGAFIILINQVKIFDLIYITVFTLPLLAFWYFVANRMYNNYRKTLHQTLTKNKESSEYRIEKEYTINTILEREINSSAEDKVIYGLKLMEHLEPALFESTIVRLANSESKKINVFVKDKIQNLGIDRDSHRSDIRELAQKAFGEVEDSDLLSISPEKLLKLSKSVRQSDRFLAAKLLRRLTTTKTIFILLELMRDVDPKVRLEALLTARKVKRPETWGVLIEMLGSPSYGHHAAAALKEAGESVLSTLETAFHKSGQRDLVMLRIVQIMGRIGGNYALQLLWRKADYPDKRIVKQILYSFRYINYRAEGRQIREVINLLETEISKTIWNLAAIHELPKDEHFRFLREALQEEVAENYDQITMLLSIIYDPQAVQLVRDNIQSGDPDSIAFALELMDIFVDQELKPKLFPLFDDLPTEEKLKQLQIHFPRESYTPVQVINYILNRDFNFSNRWTKACAVHATAFMPEFKISRGLVAQVFNSDKLLQETAAWVIYNKDKKAYEAIAERLPQRDKKYLESSIENNRLLDGLNDGFFLNIEMIMYTKQLPEFRGIHGILISDLADKITPFDMRFGEEIFFSTKAPESPIFIVAHGEVRLKRDDVTITMLRRGQVYGDLFQNAPLVECNTLQAAERSVVFKINLMDFYFVMANHHELVQGLIKNITGQIESAKSLT